EAFLRVPAVVEAGLDDVDLLVEVLADVAEPQLAGLAIEAEAPRVAQAVGVDLRPRAGGRDEGVARGRPPGRGIETEQLAEDDAEVLRVAHRVALRAAVAEAEVEVAVGTEDHVAAVVVGEGLLDGEEDGLGGGIERRASVAA